MAANSKIEWTHHTFNPWWGCSKVSPACTNCYAEAWAKRVGQDVWGKGSTRRFFNDEHWKAPLKWNKEAAKNKERKRVFCASMADVFERRSELKTWRNRLWDLIEATPMLDWLLLTKRPHNIANMVPWKNTWPDNVWLGTTVENQLWAEKRIPCLLENPAHVRFLSCEPLLGNLNLQHWITNKNAIGWVIAGGESGAGARPMHPAWVRDLRDQCLEHAVAFHFKQWGHWVPKELTKKI
jgi:protein gp37